METSSDTSAHSHDDSVSGGAPIELPRGRVAPILRDPSIKPGHKAVDLLKEFDLAHGQAPGADTSLGFVDDSEMIDRPDSMPAVRDPGSAWTLPLLCMGLALIAACILIPAADENRQTVYQIEKLKIDLAQIQKQTDVNTDFLARMADDPTLLERLARRQMKLVREGTSVLKLNGEDDSKPQLSPYLLLNVAPPEALPEYKAVGGHFAELCRAPRSRLLMIGSALLLVAVGLVMGASTDTKRGTPASA